ncbi:hypothetical protein ACLKA7_009885 [Drosophila subpalustris]
MASLPASISGMAYAIVLTGTGTELPRILKLVMLLLLLRLLQFPAGNCWPGAPSYSCGRSSVALWQSLLFANCWKNLKLSLP